MGNFLKYFFALEEFLVHKHIENLYLRVVEVSPNLVKVQLLQNSPQHDIHKLQVTTGLAFNFAYILDSHLDNF